MTFIFNISDMNESLLDDAKKLGKADKLMCLYNEGMTLPMWLHVKLSEIKCQITYTELKCSDDSSEFAKGFMFGKLCAGIKDPIFIAPEDSSLLELAGMGIDTKPSFSAKSPSRKKSTKSTSKATVKNEISTAEKVVITKPASPENGAAPAEAPANGSDSPNAASSVSSEAQTEIKSVKSAEKRTRTISTADSGSETGPAEIISILDNAEIAKGYHKPIIRILDSANSLEDFCGKVKESLPKKIAGMTELVADALMKAKN